jgi:hypothetical protein
VTPDRPAYRLTIRALPCPVPATVRLRRLLKSLLRAWDFQCVAVEELPPGHVAGAGYMMSVREVSPGEPPLRYGASTIPFTDREAPRARAGEPPAGQRRGFRRQGEGFLGE